MYSGSRASRNRNFVVESKQRMISSRSSMKGDSAKYSMWGSQLKQPESWSSTVLLLYHFIQFEQHVTFLFFRQISKIAINWEKIIGGVSENWVWRVTFELNEMVQYSKRAAHEQWQIWSRGNDLEVRRHEGQWRKGKTQDAHSGAAISSKASLLALLP